MIERTKQAIVDAFNELIQVHEFGEITIGDIVEQAEVSRATFYRYFKDKYDVMNANYKEILDKNYALSSSYRDLFERLFSEGETQLRKIKGVLRSDGVNSFEKYVYHYSKALVCEITASNRDGAYPEKEELLQLDVFCFGISYMYRKWIMGEYDIDAAVAADHLFSIMPETLKGYWRTMDDE